MPIKWGDLKSNIRLGLLKDVPPQIEGTSAAELFGDDALLVAADWACACLSQHTAQQATMNINCDGLGFQWALPDNMVDDIEKAALVIFDDGRSLEYLVPIRLQPGEFWPKKTPGQPGANTLAYWQWMDAIILTFVPASETNIEIRYWKMWESPTEDSSVLEFPRRFEQPFSYLVAATAFNPLGAQASSIRQWNRKQDSGTPMDNPLNQQADYYLKMADRLLQRVGPQDRETFYRLGPRETGFGR